jgi:lipoate-protein ligase A
VADWRGYELLVEGPGGAAENMARDEALLAAYRAGEAPPSWRLYTWLEPAVTYGRGQQAPRREGVATVPRLSGGGYVPHGADFTYCVVRERRRGFDNYEDIVAAVAAALREMGIPAAVWRDAPAGDAGRCFASLAPYDVHVRGRKVAGCAQRRYKDAVLHHGSVAAAAPSEILRRLGLWDETRTATLAELLGRPVVLAEFAESLAGATGMRPVYAGVRPEGTEVHYAEEK